MNAYYRDLFVKYLHENCKYRKSNIRTNTYKYNGKEYWRVEVLSDGYVIQAFVLMSPTHCQEMDKFPFYRIYSQWNDSGYLTPPTCVVAVYIESTKEWEIHNASDLRHEFTSTNFLNYNEAVKRFQKRLDYDGNMKLRKTIRCSSIIWLTIVFIYIIAHLLCANGIFPWLVIPLNDAVVGIIVIITVLILLPPLIPYVKSFSIKGIGVELNQD